MRKFYLENEVGARIDLQSNELFLWEPDGLGFSENREYAEAQYGFWVPSTSELEQPGISGVLVFKKRNKEPYISYMEFVEWVQAAQSLMLVYSPCEKRELYVDGYIDGLDLSEKTGYGVLECPIIFHATSPYHDKNPYVYVLETDGNLQPMRFPLKFPFVFSKSSSEGKIDVDIYGHFPAAVELHINGIFQSPILTATETATKKIVGKLDLTGVSVGENERIYFSSRPNITVIQKETADKKIDLIDIINLHDNNFFTLPPGKKYELALTGDNVPQQSTRHILRIHQYYKG